MPDVTINRCTLRIVRHGGWSWGATPEQLLQSAIKMLPQLIARELGQFWTSDVDDYDEEIAAPVRISVPIHLNELLAIGSAGISDSEFSYSSQFSVVGQRINSAVRAALINKIAPQDVVAESQTTSLRFREVVVAERRERSERAVVAVLRTWQQHGVLAQRLSVFSTEALAAWSSYFVRTSDDETVFGSERISAIESLIEECLHAMPLAAAAATRDAILRRRLIVIAELMVRFDLVRCPAVVLSKLDELLPVLATKRHKKLKESGLPSEADHEQPVAIAGSHRESKSSVQMANSNAGNDAQTLTTLNEQVMKTGLPPLVQSRQQRGQAPLPDLFYPSGKADGLTVGQDQAGSTAIEAGPSSRHTVGKGTEPQSPPRASHLSDRAVVETDSTSQKIKRSTSETTESGTSQQSVANSTSLQSEYSSSEATKPGTSAPSVANSTSLQSEHSSSEAAKPGASAPSVASSTSTQAASIPGLQRITSRLRCEASALPFLLLGPLARTGYLQTLAAVLEASENTAASPLFATAFAYKLLAPPERGWRRNAATLSTAAAFAALETPAPEPDVMQFAQAIAPHLSPLDATLSGALIAGHSPRVPLLLLSSEERLLLFDTEGIFPIQWANKPAELRATLIQLDSSIVFVPSASADVELLRWLTDEGLSFVTDAPPTRGESLRSIRRPPDLRWWTNDATTPDSVFAHMATSLPAVVEDAFALVQLLAKDRPAIALARDSALDRHLTVAAAIALGTLAWDLWKEREQTAPHLALERFADLNARVDYSDDLVTVSLPLGKRFLDLRDHGLLDDVHDVPWLDGRKLIFTSG